MITYSRENLVKYSTDGEKNIRGMVFINGEYQTLAKLKTYDPGESFELVEQNSICSLKVSKIGQYVNE